MSKRNEKGQWLPGVSGNTSGIKRISFTKKFLNTVKLKDVAEVAAALISKAKKGDLRAIKLFLDYCINPAIQTIEQTVEVDARSPEDIRKLFKAEFNTGVKK